MGTHPIFESDFDCLTDFMGKPKGENQKAVTARERKAEAHAEKKAALEKAKEDAKWADPDKHLDRKQNRLDEKASKREAELARKKELQELYEKDAAEMGKQDKKAKKTVKMTRVQVLEAQLRAAEASSK